MRTSQWIFTKFSRMIHLTAEIKRKHSQTVGSGRQIYGCSRMMGFLPRSYWGVLSRFAARLAVNLQRCTRSQEKVNLFGTKKKLCRWCGPYTEDDCWFGISSPIKGDWYIRPEVEGLGAAKHLSFRGVCVDRLMYLSLRIDQGAEKQIRNSKFDQEPLLQWWERIEVFDKWPQSHLFGCQNRARVWLSMSPWQLWHQVRSHFGNYVWVWVTCQFLISSFRLSIDVWVTRCEKSVDPLDDWIACHLLPFTSWKLSFRIFSVSPVWLSTFPHARTDKCTVPWAFGNNGI